ncbi:MAG TPA: DUF1569 domain-containing protein [Acidobacteriaceae bacterium]|jgi:hypothetical protein|nr:DUF1569 domain-containing protein [Acidobacteriaceae bacterium]
MKNLFDAAKVDEIKERIGHLQPESERQWGTMHVTEMVAHCSLGMQMALGEVVYKRPLMGRLIGGIIKPMVFKDDEPFRRNSPTMIVVLNRGSLGVEQEKLCRLIDRFTEAGPAGCTRHPHSFFGKLTPDEWAILTYKHLDHHLRQFGA